MILSRQEKPIKYTMLRRLYVVRTMSKSMFSIQGHVFAGALPISLSCTRVERERRRIQSDWFDWEKVVVGPGVSIWD